MKYVVIEPIKIVGIALKILVTGCAGFIGFNLTRALLYDGHDVVGIDNLAPSYGKAMATFRNAILKQDFKFKVEQHNLATIEHKILTKIIEGSDAVVHLAGWPGVRLSRTMPLSYSENNIHAFNNLLEAVRCAGVKRLLYASSSSIYGNQGVEGPVKESNASSENILSYYGLTKWINEETASFYSKNYGLDILGLRFFTVYGPFGRPDMAYWQFADHILKSEPIRLFGGDGGMRSFTYIDDVINAIKRLVLMDLKFNFPVLNVSSGIPRLTSDLVSILSRSLVDSHPKIETAVRPIDDAVKTWANTERQDLLLPGLNFKSLEDGIEEFARWFLSFKKT